MADTIIAIDLGRYKSVECGDSRSTSDHTVRTFCTTSADPVDLFGIATALTLRCH